MTLANKINIGEKKINLLLVWVLNELNPNFS